MFKPVKNRIYFVNLALLQSYGIAMLAELWTSRKFFKFGDFHSFMSDLKKLVGLIAAIGFILVVLGTTHPTQNKINYGPINFNEQKSTIIAEGTYIVSPLSYKAIEFTVPYGVTNPKLSLNILEKSGKDIDVEVVDSTGLKYYDSGRVQSLVKTIYLDSGKTYYIILNNKYSLITSKKVYIKAILRYENNFS